MVDKALAAALLKAQPFSRLVGAELADFKDGFAEIHLEIADDLKQQDGFVHGGVVSYLADNALTFAGGSKLGPAVLTAEMKINYIRPAAGTKLIARAVAISAGRTQSVVRCDIFMIENGTEKLCAAAQGTINVRPSKDAARN